MTHKKNPKENASKTRLYVVMDRLIKVKHRTGKFLIKIETEFHFRVKAFFERYNKKLWPRLTPKKEWKGVVGSGEYKVLVQMIE